MTVKTLTITEDAYELLREIKREDESFSQLVRRIVPKAITAREVRGLLKHTASESTEFKLRIRQYRERFDRTWRDKRHART